MSVLSSRAEMGKEKAWQAVEARLQLLQRADALAGRADLKCSLSSHGVILSWCQHRRRNDRYRRAPEPNDVHAEQRD